MSEILVGSVLARRYRVEAKLGEGGMAVVYRAFDMQRRVAVALKLLKPDYAEDTTFIHKFRREARSLQRLQHPNIVRFYEFVEDGALAFLVLDYIDGPTLRNVMRQRGRPLSPGEVLSYLRPICAALSYAHSERVVHCDVKLANVMIDRAGKVVVNDFGIARLSESATVTFSTPGTAAYMAPEQWRGGDEVYPATDIYALGVMLYELVAEQLPFTGETVETRGSTREKIMQEHLSVTPPPPSRWNPALPREFDAVILRCLTKEHASRYQSADELLAAFESACRQAGIAETPALPLAPESSQTAIPVTQPAHTGASVTTPRGSKGRMFAVVGIAGVLVVGVVALAGLVGLFASGGRLAALAPTPTSAATPPLTPTATSAPAATATPAPTLPAADLIPQAGSTAVSPEDGIRPSR